MASPIFKMFGRSPIRPMQEHMGKATTAARTLVDLFEASAKQDWQSVEKHQQTIIEMEHQADALKHDIRSHLPKSLFLPVPREDLLELITNQDRIANKAKDIAGLVVGRKMQLPESISESYLVLLNRCIEACSQALKAINELDELLEAGFRGNEVNIVEGMIEKIGHIEHDTDELQSQIYQQLYTIEKDLEPIDVMFLYKLVDWTGDLADRAELVGNILQLLLAR